MDISAYVKGGVLDVQALAPLLGGREDGKGEVYTLESLITDSRLRKYGPGFFDDQDMRVRVPLRRLLLATNDRDYTRGCFEDIWREMPSYSYAFDARRAKRLRGDEIASAYMTIGHGKESQAFLGSLHYDEIEALFSGGHDLSVKLFRYLAPLEEFEYDDCQQGIVFRYHGFRPVLDLRDPSEGSSPKATYRGRAR